MWPSFLNLKQIGEFETGFELDRLDWDDWEAFITSVEPEYCGGSWVAEQSSALELSRDNDSKDCLLTFEIANCLLWVLLERDDDWLSRLRALEMAEFDWERKANDVEGMRESCAALTAAAVGAEFEKRVASLTCASFTVSSHSSVRCARSRCRYSRHDESANRAINWSTASDSCASVKNPAYACEQRSVFRAAYAATDSDLDCRRPQSVIRYAPWNSNRLKYAISLSRNFLYDTTVSATYDWRTFSASSNPSQAKTKKP